MRCVEAWSMVIPWIGVPLADVMKRCEPTSKAKYVEFKTLMRSGPDAGPARRCSNGHTSKALRIDEAMHPLALLAVGLYGKALPNQNGAPLRLIVPWKYGFKGIKSIVEIRFVETAAADDLEHRRAAGIRLLRQRESRRSIIRAGARRASGASAGCSSGRR